VSSIANGLIGLTGWVAYLVIAALIFGETAIFVGFVLPGEIAAILGGVLASRGHLSLPLVIVVVVAAAIAGPFAGYEVGRQMGDRLFSVRALSRVRAGTERARTALTNRGGVAVFFGRFVVVVRAIMPAAAGAAPVRYRTFALYNVLGAVIWGAGYSVLGYVAGSAYAAVERRVGTGLAIAIGAVVVIGVAVWAYRRHRSSLSGPDGPHEQGGHAGSAGADGQGRPDEQGASAGPDGQSGPDGPDPE